MPRTLSLSGVTSTSTSSWSPGSSTPMPSPRSTSLWSRSAASWAGRPRQRREAAGSRRRGGGAPAHQERPWPQELRDDRRGVDPGLRERSGRSDDPGDQAPLAERRPQGQFRQRPEPDGESREAEANGHEGSARQPVLGGVTRRRAPGGDDPAGYGVAGTPGEILLSSAQEKGPRRAPIAPPGAFRP